MKNLFNYFILIVFLLGGVVATSCSSDDDASPKVDKPGNGDGDGNGNGDGNGDGDGNGNQSGIVIDGNMDDWKDIAIAAKDTVDESSLDYLKVTSDDNFIYFLVVAKEGLELGHFQIFFDSDNNPETGWVSWSTGDDKAGFDATIEYEHSDSEPVYAFYIPDEGKEDQKDVWPFSESLTEGAALGSLMGPENRAFYEMAIIKEYFKDLGDGLGDKMRIMVRDIHLDWDSGEKGALPAAESEELLTIEL